MVNLCSDLWLDHAGTHDQSTTELHPASPGQQWLIGRESWWFLLADLLRRWRRWPGIFFMGFYNDFMGFEKVIWWDVRVIFRDVSWGSIPMEISWFDGEYSIGCLRWLSGVLLKWYQMISNDIDVRIAGPLWKETSASSQFNSQSTPNYDSWYVF